MGYGQYRPTVPVRRGLVGRPPRCPCCRRCSREYVPASSGGPAFYRDFCRNCYAAAEAAKAGRDLPPLR